MNDPVERMFPDTTEIDAQYYSASAGRGAYNWRIASGEGPRPATYEAARDDPVEIGSGSSYRRQDETDIIPIPRGEAVARRRRHSLGEPEEDGPAGKEQGARALDREADVQVVGGASHIYATVGFQFRPCVAAADGVT